MKSRHYKKLVETTYQECLKVYEGKPIARLARLLKIWIKHDTNNDYDYQGKAIDNVRYCSDRMNGGRARAILRLIKEEEPTNDAKDKMFFRLS